MPTNDKDIILMRQHTISNTYCFEGKGLHTGVFSKMKLKPAPDNTGIRFIRTDLGGAFVDALVDNVTETARSTTLSSGAAEIQTLEHLMSALTGMGVDNAIIEIDSKEVPILDGSARFYAEAIAKDGLVEQEAEREYINITETIELKDEKTGSWIKIEPSERPSIDVTVDFGSKVLGVQSAHWDEELDYAGQIASCRTFVFFHEIEYLFSNNLIKGGDVDNAIVIVEHPVSEEQLDRMSKLFNRKALSVKEGYLNNLELRFPNECGRHKLLDVIGDLRLAGGYINAKVTAFKPGHLINTNAAKAIRRAVVSAHS